MNDLQHIIADTLSLLRSEYSPRGTILLSEQTYGYFNTEEKKDKKNPLESKQSRAPQRTEKIAPMPPSPLKTGQGAKSGKEQDRQTPSLQHPLPPAKEVVEQFSEQMQKKIEKILPQVKIIKELPSDSKGQKLSHAWKTDEAAPRCVILYNEEKGPLLDFLENIRKAVAERLCPCITLSIQDFLEPASKPAKSKLIITTPSAHRILCSKDMIKPGASLQLLQIDGTQALLLEELQSYFSHAEMKKALWTKICQMLRG